MRQWLTYAVSGLALALAGCGSLGNPYGPDRSYSGNADEAVELQIPPDLTDVSNAEQFVLPGNRAGAVSRSTLLPSFDSVRLERGEGQAWLAIDQTPEALWPLLLGYLRAESLTVAQTSPVKGLVTTTWQARSAEGRLRALVGGESMQRIAFRMERAGRGTRLFARSQLASADAASALGDTPEWPAKASSPEATSELLASLLVYLGASEQQTRGILSRASAQQLLKDAELLSGANGSELLLHRGYRSAYNQSRRAIERNGFRIIAEDDGLGRIQFADGDVNYLLVLNAEHVSAVRARVLQGNGQRLDTDIQQQLLGQLTAALS